RVGVDLGALEVGEGADSEATVARRCPRHLGTARVVVAGPRVARRDGREAGDEHAAGPVAAVGRAVVRRETGDAHGIARMQLRRRERQCRHDVAADRATLVGRQHLTDTGGEPDATGLDRAVVDGYEKRDHATGAWVGHHVLVRAEPRAARLLVVDL